jgi:hypothetical protein
VKDKHTMAKIVNTSPVDAQRLNTIATQIANTCAGIDGALTDLADAKAAKDAASTSATSKREEIMGAIADLSLAGQWTKAEITAASKLAIKKHNNLNTEKAMATFIGEVKRAAHPNVRDHFRALVSVRDTAWAAETESLALDKTNPQPLRKCFKRSYHALISAMAECEEGNVFTTTDNMVDFAIANDPDHDADKVAKRLEAIHATLAAFYADFPVDDIGFCVDTLASITKEELTKARGLKMGVPEVVVAPVVVPTTTTVVKVNSPKVAPAVVKPVAKVEETTPEIVDLDDLLGDNLNLAA